MLAVLLTGCISCVHAVTIKLWTTESSSAIIALVTASVVGGRLCSDTVAVASAGGIPVVVGVNIHNSAHDCDTDTPTYCIDWCLAVMGETLLWVGMTPVIASLASSAVAPVVPINASVVVSVVAVTAVHVAGHITTPKCRIF